MGKYIDTQISYPVREEDPALRMVVRENDEEIKVRKPVARQIRFAVCSGGSAVSSKKTNS
jgi:hypothetical protein